MADNLVGLNLATRAGEGNANVMSWGNLDRAANQLYQEQKQREARGYNDYMQGQAALQKEFANVRSADVPDVVAAYNDLKKTKQAILFDDKVKNDAIALAQKQQEAQLKEAQLRQLIQGSQELKEADKGINARKLSHPDDFDSDKIKEHLYDINLPLRERIKLGKLDSTPYLYKGVDASKLGQWAKESAGTSKAVPIGDEVVADEGYKLEQKHILRGNNPVQYADGMYKRFQTNKGGQAASALLNQMSDVKKQQIISQFNAIPDAEFKSKWGVDKNELINGVLPDDKTGQYVLLDAMQYAINNMPKEAESKFRPNEAFKTKENIAEWNRRNAITSAQKAARAETVSGKTMQELGIRDVFGEVNNAVSSGRAKPLNELSSTAQGVILKYARDITGDKLGQGEIAIFRGGDNKIGIWSVKRQKNKSGVEEDVVDKLIAPIDFTDINVPTQAGVKEKRAVIKSGNKSVPSPKPKKDPLGLFNN